MPEYEVGQAVRITRCRGMCCGVMRCGTDGIVESVITTQYGYLYIMEGGETAYEEELSKAVGRIPRYMGKQA